MAASRRGLAGGFWPTEEQDLLLRTVLLDDEESEHAWQLLKPRFDVRRCQPGTAVLLPLLYETLRRRGGAEPFTGTLKGVYRQVWYRNQLGLNALREALRPLQRAGIETTVLDAAALIVRYYGRLGVRPLDEPIVLVHPKAREAALQMLSRSGWLVVDRGSGWRERVYRSAPSGRQACALDWRVLAELQAQSDHASPDRFWDRAEETEVRGGVTRTLAPSDELLRTCVAGARSGRSSNVQWIADAMTILRSSAAELDWGLLVEEAATCGCAQRVRDALAYLSAALGAPIPDGVGRELDGLPHSSRELVAYRVSGRGGRLLGNLPATLGVHLVATQDESLLKVASTLPGFLRTEWGLDRLARLPGAFVARGAAGVSAVVRRRQHAR